MDLMKVISELRIEIKVIDNYLVKLKTTLVYVFDDNANYEQS